MPDDEIAVVQHGSLSRRDPVRRLIQAEPEATLGLLHGRGDSG